MVICAVLNTGKKFSQETYILECDLTKNPEKRGSTAWVSLQSRGHKPPLTFNFGGFTDSPHPH